MERALIRVLGLGVAILAVAAFGFGYAVYEDLIRPALAPRATAAAAPTPRATVVTAEPTARQCLRWQEVTTRMAGQRVCVEGRIHAVRSSRATYTRYQFSPQPNTFFLYSVNHEWYDPATGKSLGPGVCVWVFGVVEVVESVPNISIDRAWAESDQFFKFSLDPGDCAP